MAGACGDWKGLIGSGGGGAAGAGSSEAAGITTMAPHCGHLACRPAVPSPVRKSFPQLVQRNSIDMGPSLQVSPKIAWAGDATQGEFDEKELEVRS